MENNIDCRKFRLYISKKIKTISPPTRGYLFKFKKHFFFHLRKLCKSCLYYDEFFLASLRFNLHRIKYTHLKCIVWWVLVIMYDCKTTTTIFILLCFALLLFTDNCFFFFFSTNWKFVATLHQASLLDFCNSICSFWITVFIFSRYMPRSGIAGSHGNSF